MEIVSIVALTLVILTLRRKEVSDIIVGRITQCEDSDSSDIDSSDIDSKEEGGN